MDNKELINLLTTSTQCLNETKFIPWWEGDHKNTTYRYDILSEQEQAEAIECIAQFSKEELLKPVGNLGLTIFHLLVWHNFYDTVKQLLDDGTISGEEVDVTDSLGHNLTPFLMACMLSNLNMVKLLLEHGADISHSDARNMNAYHFLVYPRADIHYSSSCVKETVDQRNEIARLLTCDINQKDGMGLTPLVRMLSTEYCADYTWPMVDIYLEKGAQTDYVDENGNTLLMLAWRNGHSTAALRLMKDCPEMVNTPNNKGITPLMSAIDYRDQGIYLVLLDHGAKSEDTGSIELFPLSQIISNAFSDVSRYGKDKLGIALYLTQKLIDQSDFDDDDDVLEILRIFGTALERDPDATIVNICKDAGMDFTTLLYSFGDPACLRDMCLEPRYGIGVIQKLIEIGVDMDMAVSRGKTPANIVASKEKWNDSDDETYFKQAVRLFSRESMEELDDQGKAAIHYAAEKGHAFMLAAMIEKGVDINLAEDAPAQSGTTPLHEACIYGCEDVVRLLINAGADDTLKSADGETPAHFALMHKKFGEKLSLEKRAGLLRELKHLDVPDDNGKTPVMLLTSSTWQLFPIFVEKGVDLNHKDNHGRTILMLEKTDKDMAKDLIRLGADIDATDNDGNTALHYAVQNCSERLARFLIKKGADYNRPNNDGETPALIAVERGYSLLLDLMTDIK